MPGAPRPKKTYFCGGRRKDMWGGGSSRRRLGNKGQAAGAPLLSAKAAKTAEQHQALLRRCQPTIGIVFEHRMTLDGARSNFASFARQLKEQKFPGSDAPRFVEDTVQLMLTEFRRRMAGRA